MVTVGPLIPSGHESELDIDRRRDYGNFSDVVPEAARAAGGASKIKLTPIEEQDIQKVSAGILFLDTRDGLPEDEVMSRAEARRDFLINKRRVLTKEMAPTYGPDVTLRDLAEQTDALERIQQEEAAWKDSITFGEQLDAGINQHFFTNAIARSIRRLHTSQIPDAAPFYYEDFRKEAEEGRPYDDRLWLQQAESEAELRERIDQLNARDENFKIMAAKGDGRALLAGVTSAGLDPTNLLMGVGIAKAFRLKGLSGAVGLERGSRAMTIAGTAGEAAAASVLTSTALEAMGENVTVNDHIIYLAGSIGAGAVFGRLMYAGVDMDERAAAQAMKLSNEALAVESRWYAQAQRNLGTGADKDALAAEVRRIMLDEYKQAQDIALAPVDDVNRWTPQVEQRKGAEAPSAEPVGPEQRVVPREGRLLKAAPEDAELVQRYREELLADAGARLSRGDRKALEAERRELENQLAKVPVIDETADILPRLKAENPRAPARRLKEMARAESERRTAESRKPLEEAIAKIDERLADNAGKRAAEADLSRLEQGLIPESLEARYLADAGALSPERAAAIAAEREAARAAQPKAAPAPKEPPANMLPQEVLDDVIARYNLDGPAGVPANEREVYRFSEGGLKPETITDDIERRMIAETIARAERMEKLDPVDEARLATFMARFPQLASTGLILLRSKNPVLRAFGMSVAESTTRASGNMRTAAIAKFQRLTVYRDSVLPEVDLAFKDWARANGYGIIERNLGTKAYSDFNRDLYRYRRAVERGNAPADVHPSIKRASDALDRGFNMARMDMQKVGTIGAARLGADSAGYMPRMWSTRWFVNANREQLNAVAQTISKQMQVNEGWDKEFADAFAARYMNHARERARGAVEAPANLYDDDAVPNLIKDVMRARGLSTEGEEAEKLLGRFSRGGATFTRKRVDMDETTKVRTESGEEFYLADVFENDLVKLYSGYIDRASGEVALAQYGIYGKQGIGLIERAAAFAGEVTPDEWNALSQIAGEMLGQPVRINGQISYSRGMQNLRMLASSSMLGGMGFTQVAELANAIGPLGLRSTLRMYKGLPGAIADIRAGRKSPLLEGFEFIGGEPGMEAHAVTRFMDTAGDIVPVGAEDLTVMGRALRVGANGTQIVSGHRAILAAQHRLVAEQIMLKAIRYIKNGGDDIALKEMGLSREVRERLLKDIDNVAKFDKDGNLTAVDPFAATDKEAMDILGKAVTRGTRQIIQGTFIGERGRWAHSELLKALFQFRTFPLVAMEKQLAHGMMAYGALATAGMIASGMAFAVPIYALRVAANSMGRENAEEYREKMLEPDMIARAAMNYTAKLGLWGDVLDATAAVAGGSVVGRQAPGGDLVDALPVASYVNRAARAVTEQDVADGLRSMPMGNVPGVVQAINLLDQVASEK